eukprot:8757306-Pyramimonas_sp.AAC.1
MEWTANRLESALESLIDGSTSHNPKHCSMSGFLCWYNAVPVMIQAIDGAMDSLTLEAGAN